MDVEVLMLTGRVARIESVALAPIGDQHKAFLMSQLQKAYNKINN